MDINEHLVNSQRITDMRLQMLRNIQEGKPTDFGVDEAMITAALDAARNKRSEAWERGQKKGRKAAAAAEGGVAPSRSRRKSAPSGPLTGAAAGLFAALGAAEAKAKGEGNV